MKEAECYPGKRVGRLTLIEKRRIPSGKWTQGGWLCHCDCGNKTVVRTNGLGKTVSCGCYAKDKVKEFKTDFHEGDKVGRLPLLRRWRKECKTYSQWDWDCLCDCGNTKVVSQCHLGRDTLSCGCLNKEKTAESNSKYSDHDSSPHSKYHPLYGKWKAMIQRCENPQTHFYADYGGRGIKVCEEWHDYEVFKQWSLENGFDASIPNAGSIFTIDRIDVNGNYEPSNCRYVGYDVQQYNRRNNIFIKYKGSYRSIQYIADDLGYNWDVIYHRWLHGDTGERLIRPVQEETDYEQVIVYEGKHWTINEIAERIGITPSAVRHRYQKGDRGDRLFRPKMINGYREAVDL